MSTNLFSVFLKEKQRAEIYTNKIHAFFISNGFFRPRLKYCFNVQFSLFSEIVAQRFISPGTPLYTLNLGNIQPARWRRPRTTPGIRKVRCGCSTGGELSILWSSYLFYTFFYRQLGCLAFSLRFWPKFEQLPSLRIDLLFKFKIS